MFCKSFIHTKPEVTKKSSQAKTLLKTCLCDFIDCTRETFWPVTCKALSAAMRNCTLMTVWGVGCFPNSKPFCCFLVTICKQIVHGEKKLSPSGGQDNPDNDWQQLNKAPVWQRRIDTKHANKQQNLSCCMPPQMRQREKRSLTRCCPSKLVCKEKRRESSVTKWVWEIMQRQTVSVAGRGGGREDVVTSDLKPRDGAC